MVQRKVPNKLGIQADHVKSEKKLLANLKPSSLQHQGADLKKKQMKKSGSFKRPEADRLRSSNVKRQIQQPGKPPPEKYPATPEKQSPIKAVMETTPNYMKSTSSSDARKERSLQVSSRTSSDGKSSIRRNIMKSNEKGSQISDSGNRTARTLTRTSSLKLVRTLTKAPSFKPTRASAKKCSPMILCENLNVQRATCSSTIKGHRFPDYLTLSTGATEAAGTSSMKVCPYTYCSLNGHHHHDPLPPLKSFLTARRRTLKAQRSIKLGCLSPRRFKPIPDMMKEIEVEQRDSGEHPPYENSSVVQEEQTEYFIEIYSKEKKSSQNDQEITDSSAPKIKGSTEVGDQHKFVEPEAENCFPEENQNRGVFEEVEPPNMFQGKAELNLFDFLYKLEVKGTPSIESEESDSENYDMDWEAGAYSDGSYDGGAKAIKIIDMIDLEKANSVLDNGLFNEDIFKSDEATGEGCQETIPDEILQESIDDESASEAWSGDDVPEYFSSYPNTGSSNGNLHRVAIEELTNGSDDHVDNIPEKAVEKSRSDEASEQMRNQETEDFYYMGSQEFGDPSAVSEDMMKKFKNSIGTQTDNEPEYLGEVSGNLAEVPKRSIGTQTDFEVDQPDAEKGSEQTGDDENQPGASTEEDNAKETSVCEALPAQVQDSSSSIQSSTSGDNLNRVEMECKETTESAVKGIYKSAESSKQGSITRIKEGSVENSSHEEMTEGHRIIKGTSRDREEDKVLSEFNPRAPNFLLGQPDPEAEKVDLRHLTLDGKKNADEWMVDFALQQAVTKLAPARKRKVALLVEAFETVSPTQNYETHIRHSSSAFSQARTIQACS